MNCPHCRVELDEASPTCPGCGQDAQFAVRAPDGASYGPYTLSEIRSYAAEGRIAPSAVLVSATGETLTLGQARIAASVPYVTQPSYAPVAAPAATTSAAVPCGVIALICAVVGLAIIAILAAILFPVFARAREKARQASCQANLKQISLGLLMYAQDYNQVLPLEADWRAGIYPYTKNQMIFECPSSNLGQNSYDLAAKVAGVTMAEFPTPAYEPMAYDAGLAAGGGPHNGGGNVGYLDGHVKWLSDQNFQQPPSPPAGPGP